MSQYVASIQTPEMRKNNLEMMKLEKAKKKAEQAEKLEQMRKESK
jgi:hypothetical protein